MSPSPRSARLPALAIVAVALVATFVLAPAALLADEPDLQPDALGAATGDALSAWWSSGAPGVPDDLARLADHWFRWHALKTLIALALVVVLAALTRELRRRAAATGRRRTWLAAGAGSLLIAGSTAAVLLNVQATARPLVALLPLAPADRLDPAFLAALTGAGDEPGRAGDHPASTVLVADVRLHAAALLLPCGLLAVLAVVELVRRRRRRTDPVRPRSADGPPVTAVAVLVMALALAVTAVTGVVDPASALADLMGVGS